MKRLLITGASGNLGVVCRERLTHLADIIRLSCRGDLGESKPHEEIMRCELGDKFEVDALVKGCDGIVHMGGQSVEAAWGIIRRANIDGMVNLYEAARKHGVKRIVFASSNHAIGFYRQTQLLDADAPTRPDGLYGVSKIFGEALASMYHDKFGIETACIRIGSCLPEPADHRMLSTWMSHDDFIRLIECIFTVRKLGCPIIYGVSDNDSTWWDNRKVSYLGWRPRDNSEVFRGQLDERMDPPDADDARAVYQGGTFAADVIHED